MKKPALSRARKLFGTDVPDGKKRTLTAGPITAVLDNGGAALHPRPWGQRCCAALPFWCCDKNWGTYGPVIENLKVAQGKDSFKVSYTATCSDATQGIRL